MDHLSPFTFTRLFLTTFHPVIIMLQRFSLFKINFYRFLLLFNFNILQVDLIFIIRGHFIAPILTLKTVIQIFVHIFLVSAHGRSNKLNLLKGFWTCYRKLLGLIKTSFCLYVVNHYRIIYVTIFKITLLIFVLIRIVTNSGGKIIDHTFINTVIATSNRFIHDGFNLFNNLRDLYRRL